MNQQPPRSPWPIAIATFFALAISFLIAFIVFAVRQREDLVSPDYYEREIRYQSQLDSINRSRSMAANPVVTFEPGQQVIVITLPIGQTRGATGNIQLYRPSDARLDRVVPLALDPAGRQRLDARQLRDGLWKIRVQWSAAGQAYFVDQPVIVAL